MIVAEKPSVAMAYAKVLGATSRQDGYLEGNGYLVSWCVGHLVELAPPNIYDAKSETWPVADAHRERNRSIARRIRIPLGVFHKKIVAI